MRGGDCDIWINGVEVETANKASASGVNTNGQLDVGYQTRDNSDYFHGELDQVTIQNMTQPTQWIESEYCNQVGDYDNAICDFYDLGSEMNEPVAGGGPTPEVIIEPTPLWNCCNIFNILPLAKSIMIYFGVFL